MEDIKQSRYTPQAFSHFTFERSGHELIVVDIQGVGDLYTDPQIHTMDGNYCISLLVSKYEITGPKYTSLYALIVQSTSSDYINQVVLSSMKLLLAINRLRCGIC